MPLKWSFLLEYLTNCSHRRIAICIRVESPNFCGRKFSVPDANVVDCKVWHCLIWASNRQGSSESKRPSTSPSIFNSGRGITSIYEKFYCFSIYWNCDEIPFHERWEGNPCVEPRMFISAGHCDYTLTPPYAEPNSLKNATTIINKNLERGPDRAIHLQPKGHCHSRINLTRTEGLTLLRVPKPT